MGGRARASGTVSGRANPRSDWSPRTTTSTSPSTTWPTSWPNGATARITAWVLDERDRLRSHGAFDRVFTVHRTWADLRFIDLGLDPSERPTGCYLGDPKTANYGSFGLACTSTLRSWLSMWSLAESSCRAGPHLAGIVQPSLVVQSTADQGCYPGDATAIFDSLGSEDKRLEMVAGDHYLSHPAHARPEVADLVAGWLARWQ